MPTRPLLAALVAACVLAACGGTDAGDQVVGGDAGPDPADTDLLDFEATAVDGSTVDVADFAGEDLVVWFWAPW